MKLLFEYLRFRFINLLTFLFYAFLIIFGIYAYMFFQNKEQNMNNRLLVSNYPIYLEDIGQSFQLEPLQKDTKVTYESTDTSIATVDSTGKITAVDYGSVTIIAKSSNMRQPVKVVVAKDPTSGKIDIKIPLPNR